MISLGKANLSDDYRVRLPVHPEAATVTTEQVTMEVTTAQVGLESQLESQLSAKLKARIVTLLRNEAALEIPSHPGEVPPMNYPSIRLEGAILSPDILDRLEDAPGQRPTDFGMGGTVRVKDEIARAWADAQDYWRIFQRKLETLRADSPATTETRQQWMVPLLGLLGYQLEYQARGVELNGKTYAISHRVTNRGNTPLYIIGYREPAGLDRKPEKVALRMSAHAMVQEYLNLQDELYGLVTNGCVVRLLRDSSRLIKLTYLEFDLDRIFTDGLFADFAVCYRLLHASRLPQTVDAASTCWLERYHQDSLDAGARIRDGLRRAVAQAIRDFANGFLAHPANDALRQAASAGELQPDAYYQYLLRLIYRLLFLMVIEERDLIFPSGIEAIKRDIYDDYYSLRRLRRLAEKRYLADRRKHDLWLSLLATFRLFEAGGPGHQLGIAPLAGDLFSPAAIGLLGRCTLGNDVLVGCLQSLGLYEHPDTRQIIRVNYAALNVEEFGSVYEGLLECTPHFLSAANQIEFTFTRGDESAATGSHYTPDDLVQPLIKHSLDYLIAEKLQDSPGQYQGTGKSVALSAGGPPAISKGSPMLKKRCFPCVWPTSPAAQATSCSPPLGALPQSWPSSAPVRSNPRPPPSALPCAM